MSPTATQPTEQVVSIDTIPQIRRRKSDSFEEIVTKLKSLQIKQALTIQVTRTKKGELNRQFSVKVQKYLGKTYTVISRMGNPELIKGQDPNELYVYIFKTPTQQSTTTK